MSRSGRGRGREWGRHARLRIGLLLLALAVAAPASTWASPEQLDEPLLREMIESFVRSRSVEVVRSVSIPPLESFVVADASDFDVAVSTEPGRPMRGRVPVNVTVSSGGQTLREGVVPVRVDAERRVVVTRRALRRGSLIAASDLAVEPRVVGDRPNDWLVEPAPAVGMRLRRSLAAGMPVGRDALETPPAVRRGQRVKLELRHGRLRIDAFGQAQQDGAVGEWIRVRNLASKRDVNGRVGADGVIHVDF